MSSTILEPLYILSLRARTLFSPKTGGFIATGWLARGMAENARSKGMQSVGLGLYVLAESIIFVPILYIATYYSSPDVFPTAATITGLPFLSPTLIEVELGKGAIHFCITECPFFVARRC